MKQYQTYRCSVCGNEVEVQHVGGGTLTCCGQAMECTTNNLKAVNLMKAFAGESMARNKYDLFADIARDEGWHAIERHFREAALNEMWHARAEYKAYHKMMEGQEVEATMKNLETGMEGEHYEHTEMYPNFAAIAEEEGHKALARLFNAIAKVEVEHEREYAALKQAMIDDGFLRARTRRSGSARCAATSTAARSRPGPVRSAGYRRSISSVNISTEKVKIDA